MLIKNCFPFLCIANEKGREVNDLMQQLKEERTQFLKQRKEKPILKKGGNRESEVS